MLARFVATVVLFFASLAAAITLQVPSKIDQCDTIQILARGEGALNVAVLNAENECGDAIHEWLNVRNGNQSWTVTSKPGTQLLFLVEERNSVVEKWSQVLTVGEGDADCLEGSRSASGSASATGSASSTLTATGGPGGAANIGNNPNGSTSSDGPEETGAPGSAARFGASLVTVAGAALLAVVAL